MRLFTAVATPEDVAARLRECIERLRPLADVQWTHPSDLHLTTKYLGEVAPSLRPEVDAALRLLPARLPFRVVLRRLGWFPDARKPRVLWAGVYDPVALASLASDTERALLALGVPPEGRPYAAHVTLARLRANAPVRALVDAVASERPAELGEFVVDSFSLFESRRVERDGPAYRELARFAL